MATTQIGIKYKPIRIGFLVRENEIPDVVKVAEINTLLWGGIYNRLIVVGKDLKFPKIQILAYDIDILIALTTSPEIEKVISTFDYLRDPHRISEGVVYEGDWRAHKNTVAFLGIENVTNRYWNSEYKNSQKKYSNCALPNWDTDNALSNLFILLYGKYPDDLNLKIDYKKAFEKRMKARKVDIVSRKSIPGILGSTIHPLQLTQIDLRLYGGSSRESGVFVGDEKSFKDMVSFWNLRASGIDLAFLSVNTPSNFYTYIKAFAKRIDNRHFRYLKETDDILIHYGEVDEELVKSVSSKVQTNKRKILHHHTWGEYQSSYAVPILGSTSTTMTVEQKHGKYSCHITLPEKKFVELDENESQSMAVIVTPYGEFEYPNHTLHLPRIKQLNEQFSREVAYDPWELRTDEDGVSCITQTRDTHLNLYPISYRLLVEKVLLYIGIRSKLSQPGLIVERILEKIGGIDGGRVFKIPGVRKLISELTSKDNITRQTAIQKIKETGNFSDHETLHIEARKEPKLTPSAVFDFLLKYDFFRAGLEFKCGSCGLRSWLALKEIDDIWNCVYCGYQNRTSLDLRNRGDWKFRKSGLFANDNNQEGAIPVILTLLVLLRVFNDGFVFMPSLNLSFDSFHIESDFLVMQYRRGERLEIALGECKSEGGVIDRNDIDNMKKVRMKIVEKGFVCYLIFSKTAEEFTQPEIELFKELDAESIPIVLFTNSEIEPYEPYWSKDADALPHKSALSFKDLNDNSIAKYKLRSI